MTIPDEFTEAAVKANSPPEEQLYSDFLRCGEPWKSMYRNNPWLLPPDMRKPLEWGTGRYWDTTVARKHSYWKNEALPVSTKDIHQMRKDFKAFGYCMVQDAFSPEQLKEVRTRVVEQAEGERMAGVAFWYSGGAGSGHTTHATQFVPTLVNKGEVFAKIICHEPEAIQGGPVIEQILSETVGPGWCVTSFLSIIAGKGGHPQNLHQV